jgi:hypothetical protein
MFSRYEEPPRDVKQEWVEEVFEEIDEDTWDEGEEWFLSSEPVFVFDVMWDEQIKPTTAAYIVKAIYIMIKKRGN